MPKDTYGRPMTNVGVVGAGQLARMMAEAASPLGLSLTVLANDDSESACATASAVVHGDPTDPAAIERLANAVDVVTLDHELVNADALATIAPRCPVRPDPAALRFAQRKDFQRTTFAKANIPVPPFVVLETADPALVEAAARRFGGPPVVKSSVGGYDGRGVVVAESAAEALAAVEAFIARGPVVLEQRLALTAELAALAVTAVNGERRWWPLVRTRQVQGMCAEVTFPAAVPAGVAEAAHSVADQVARAVGAIGVLAVELFVAGDEVLVNEVAVRPHNSGHWTIEGAVTSQFENHLRAVCGLPLGETTPRAAAATMVNVTGADAPGSLAAALAIPGAHVHDYGKAFRPGRKLGHVTVVGEDGPDARVRAWAAARALGTAFAEEGA